MHFKGRPGGNSGVFCALSSYYGQKLNGPEAWNFGGHWGTAPQPLGAHHGGLD